MNDYEEMKKARSQWASQRPSKPTSKELHAYEVGFIDALRIVASIQIRSEADRDGDRYRWIKRHARHIEIATLTQMFGMGPTDLDRVLDTAMKQDCSTSPQEGKS